MSGAVVSVAIPVRDGGPLLEQTLAAVDAQQIAAEIEVVVCDSGSRDGSVAVARRHGAQVIQIEPEHFSHGGTRNLLMQRSQGGYVAFLTQDARPADRGWLAGLMEGFSLASQVGLVFGPYVPRAAASPMVARELTEWFASMAPDGQPRIDRLAPDERALPARSLLGPRGYFTDANGCVARSAWEMAPFRDVPYAEDHALAHDMLRVGFAKVFMPRAAVVHSHEYSEWDWLRRSFDEARALKEVYGWAGPVGLRTTALNVWGRVGADHRWVRARGASSSERLGLLARATLHHGLRSGGAALGARAQRLPRGLVERLSLEGRVR